MAKTERFIADVRKAEVDPRVGHGNIGNLLVLSEPPAH